MPVVVCGGQESLRQAAAAVARLSRDRRHVVAIDGADGAGKTTFADRLAPLIERPVAGSAAT